MWFQAGGKGGDGHAVITKFANVSVGERCGSGGTCDLGTIRNPARTCQELKDAGRTEPGTFYVGPVAGRSAPWHCDFSGTTASGYTWGDGKEGNVRIAGRNRYITDCEGRY